MTLLEMTVMLMCMTPEETTAHIGHFLPETNNRLLLSFLPQLHHYQNPWFIKLPQFNKLPLFSKLPQPSDKLSQLSDKLPQFNKLSQPSNKPK
jgi:hypothetical protein